VVAFYHDLNLDACRIINCNSQAAWQLCIPGTVLVSRRDFSFTEQLQRTPPYPLMIFSRVTAGRQYRIFLKWNSKNFDESVCS
jgi:hypothetical protein